MTRLRVLSHPSSLDHDTGPGHPERPARIRAIRRALEAAPLAPEWVEAPPAARADLERAHPPAHLDMLAARCASGGGLLDEDTVVSVGSWPAALHAAGAAIAAARSALAGTPAFAMTRPPGHHATATRAMGFCLINNVVVAARAVLDAGAVSRVLVVDWDVHHGNGTQDLVWDDARIRYVSLHQWPLYPGTGREDERGAHGNVFNVPRPPGEPRDRYVEALDAAVTRAVDGWTPGLMLVSAGFDAMAGDPLAGFTLEPEDYATWIARWRALGVPLASVLEGGYAPERIAQAALAHAAALVA
jgi:acetoin utilization deacetylase AcuC-like enzyme